ncbi:MAG: lysophospholipid acyltransferase family protein [Candidatus Brocadiia bacterium]|nr:1-acyl-sn-glycerol-3-phosphate acyltransferase [Planctomycetota bacterium]
MKCSGLQRHSYSLLYSICRIASIAGITCLTGVRHFNVPDISRFDGVLFASNHQSFLDPVLVGIGLERPVHYLAKQGLFEIPGLGWLIRRLGAHPIRRGKVDSTAIRTTLQVLRSGEPLLIFPEGTRTETGDLRKMRPGIGSIALRCHVPVIPVCIEGAFRSWPRNRKLPRPAWVAVRYGNAIQPDQKNGNELTKLITAQIQTMQFQLNSYLGRKMDFKRSHG